MVYLVEVIIYTALLLLPWRLLLRNKPLHGFSRLYLVCCALLPTVLPLLTLPEAWTTPVAEVSEVSAHILPAVIISGNVSAAPVPVTGFSWFVLLPYVYGLVTFLLLLWRTVQLFGLRAVIRKGVVAREKDYTIVTNTEIGPGSFGRYIFFPGDEVNQAILEHEAGHVRLKHSADILLFSFLQCIFWPNLFLVLVKRELKQVHEFQADACVQLDISSYASLLLSGVFGTCMQPYVHSFSTHPVGRRIYMLQQKISSAGRLRSIVCTVSVLLVFITGIVSLQSCRQSASPDHQPASQHIDMDRPFMGKIGKGDVYMGKVYTGDTLQLFGYDPVGVADKMPQPSYDVVDFIRKHVTAPLSPQKVTVLVRFTVDKKGKITYPSVTNPVSPLSKTDSMEHIKGRDERDIISAAQRDAALNVICTMPPWVPGEKNGQKVAVFYIIPIVFEKNTDTLKWAATELRKGVVAVPKTSDVSEKQKKEAQDEPTRYNKAQEAGAADLLTGTWEVKPPKKGYVMPVIALDTTRPAKLIWR